MIVPVTPARVTDVVLPALPFLAGHRTNERRPLRKRMRRPVPDTAKMAGALIAERELFQALLKYGTADRYVVVGDPMKRAAQERAYLETFEGFERVHLIRPWQLRECVDPHHSIVLEQRSVDLAFLASARSQGHLPSIPLCGMTHSLSGHGAPQLAMTVLLSRLEHYDRIICTSRAAADVLKRIESGLRRYVRSEADVEIRPLPCALDVIPLGTDVDKFTPGDIAKWRKTTGLPAASTVALYHGRLSTRFKADLRVLIRSFAAVREDSPDLVLVISGAGASHDVQSLRRYAAACNCLPSVVFRPNQTDQDVVNLYRAADFFVSPVDNIQETFGLTLIEAMACGLPVIASNWSGYADIVDHNGTGFLVDTLWAAELAHDHGWDFMSEDTQAWVLAKATTVDHGQLCHYMRLLARDRGLRAALGAAARRKAESVYGWKNIVEQYEAVWTESLGASRHPRCSGAPLFPRASLFGPFASHTLMPQDVLETTEWAGDAAAEWPAWEMCIEGAIDQDAIRCLLERCATGNVTAAAAMWPAPDERHLSPQDLYGAMIWLLKYGLVRVRSANA